MNIGNDAGHHPLFLALLITLALVMALGCQSLKFTKKEGDGRWVCPEFADLPLRQSRFEEAVEQHLQVLSQEPENGLAHYHLGYAYGQLGLHTEEIVQYQRAIDLGMERGDLYYNLGMAHMELEQYDRAEQSFHQAVEKEPDYGDNHRGLGLAHLKQEHYHEAIVSCRRAATLEPDDPDSWHCLALAAAKADEVGESWNAVKELLKLDPDYMLDPLLLQIFPSKGTSPVPNYPSEPRDPR